MGSVMCTFCELIENGDATWRLQTPEVLALRPLSELAPGHTLVVPRAHTEGLLSASSKQLEETMTAVQRVAAAMKTALGATGTCILHASGPDSSGSVPHLHFHVVPCWADDGTTFWPENTSAHVIDENPHELLAKALS